MSSLDAFVVLLCPLPQLTITILLPCSLQAIFVNNSSVEALKRQGLKVIRAQIAKNSRLIGRTAAEAKFSEIYKASIVQCSKEERMLLRLCPL